VERDDAFRAPVHRGARGRAGRDRGVGQIAQPPGTPKEKPLYATRIVRLPVSTTSGNAIVEEQWCRFGPDKHLVGVLEPHLGVA
jgi:hypothetical protein